MIVWKHFYTRAILEHEREYRGGFCWKVRLFHVELRCWRLVSLRVYRKSNAIHHRVLVYTVAGTSCVSALVSRSNVVIGVSAMGWARAGLCDHESSVINSRESLKREKQTGKAATFDERADAQATASHLRNSLSQLRSMWISLHVCMNLIVITAIAARLLSLNALNIIVYTSNHR